MQTQQIFSETQLQWAKDAVVKHFGHDGQARVFMISVENCEAGDHVREIDTRIVNELLRIEQEA